VSNVDKRLSVLGDRVWKDHAATRPVPMTTMPVDWAHAFGGQRFDRNPYGKGAEPVTDGETRVIPLPNVDHYGAILRSPSDGPDPAGLLPMDVTFAQRRQRAGTYDMRWFKEHFPGLPPDAAPTFFNVAPEDQWIDGFFRGDEKFLVENMHPEQPSFEGELPGLIARCFVTHRTDEAERFVEIPLRCDTVWLFPSAGFGVVIFHGSRPVAEDDATDIVHLLCACEAPQSPRPVEHYQQALVRRLDKDKGALAGLSDSDLMPVRESGVVPNISGLDIGRWVKSENLHAQNLRRGVERQRAHARARVEAAGYDPKDFGLVDPRPEPEAPPDDLDNLATHVEALTARADALMADAKEQEAKARERARQMCADAGQDYDAMMEAAKGAGPPKASAVTQLERLREVGGGLSAAQRAEFARQDRSLLEMYQRFAHLQPTAGAMNSESSDRVRILVQLAIETGESLAARDFTGANLAGMNLRGVDFTGAFLEAADLSGCDLKDAKLKGTVLAKANLWGADLQGVNLAGANLGGAVLENAVLDGADLAGSILSRASLRGASFVDANLTDVDWMETNMGGANQPFQGVFFRDSSSKRAVET
jgi:uncharacterized protein YjbI with pentapeptide repeats